MTSAITLTINTKKNLTITTSIKLYNNNYYRDFSIISADTSTDQSVNISETTGNQLDAILTSLLNRNVRSLQSDLKEIGIELVESTEKPIK